MGPGAGTSIPLVVFLCPSDGMGGIDVSQSYGTFIRGNYLAFFGNLDYGSAQPGASTSHLKAAFGFNYGARFADIVDGTSNTMVIAEYLRGLSQYDSASGGDFRGSIWSDQPGYSQVYTRLTPNSSSPDYIFTGYCYSRPELNLPCTNSNGGGNDSASPRSRHLGGVSVLFADGSVHFISDNIALNTWQALGSIAAGEVPGDY
jgi:prepilin-type processing-associated H-X9-DG protein